MVATAFAVSVYGLYQLMVEMPLIRAEYLRNPQAILQKLGIEPGGRGEELFRNRLVSSTEFFSTFGWPIRWRVFSLVRSWSLSRLLSEPGAPRRVGIAVGGPGHGGAGRSWLCSCA